jgi:hypothetical protein
MAVAQATPSLPAAGIQLQNILEILNSFRELLLCPEDAGDGIHSWNRPLVVTQSLFISIHSTLQITHQFGQASYRNNWLVAKLQLRLSRKPTYLKPYLLVERGNLLSGGERRHTLLALNWDCWHMTIGLRVRCEMRRSMMRSHTRCRRRLSVRHDFSILDMV